MTERDSRVEQDWRQRTVEIVLLLLPVLWAAVFSLLACFLRWPPWLIVIVDAASGVLFLFGLSRSHFIQPSRVWGGLVVLAILTNLVSLAYRAGAPARASRYQDRETCDLTAAPQKLTLDLVYPRTVPLEAPGEPGRPLSVYFWPPILPTATVTPTPTTTAPTQRSPLSAPTPTPATPTQAFTCTFALSRTVAIALLCQTLATGTITPTSTQDPSYAVVFLPNDNGLLFSNEKGVPVPPKLVVRPEQTLDRPSTIYLRRAPTDTTPISVSMRVQVYGPGGDVQGRTTLTVQVEDKYDAWWRHFWDLILGPATPLVALAATLAGFGWQWWEADKKRRREQQERLAEIVQVRVLLAQGKLQQALEKLIEVSRKVEGVWDRDEALEDCLAGVQKDVEAQPWRQELHQRGLRLLSQGQPELYQVGRIADLLLALDPGHKTATDLRRAVEMRQAFRDSRDRWMGKAEQLGVEQAVESLVRISIDGDDDLLSVLAELLADLASRPKYLKTVAQKLTGHWAGRRLLDQSIFQERLKPLTRDRSLSEKLKEIARGLLDLRERRFAWPDLWPELRPSDPPAVVAWLGKDGIDLEFSPFGPERAEQDPLLPRFFVPPPGWETMKAMQPAIIFGAAGSGRTAARLLLAHTCRTTPLGPGSDAKQVDTFPVRVTLLLEGEPDEADVICCRVLTRALVQALLDFLAHNPLTFAQTPFRRRRALARLFALHRPYLGDLVTYLIRGCELDGATADRLVKEIDQAGHGTDPPDPDDRTEILAVLEEARLSPFRQYYVLAEVPEPESVGGSFEQMATHLNSVLNLIPSLAARRIYLKLFVPAKAKDLLKFPPPQLSEVELVWSVSDLRAMLEVRARQAGAAEFGGLFGHVPPDKDPAGLLAQAALESEGPPRRLIQLGNELLTEHVRTASYEPKIRFTKLEGILSKSMS